MRHSQNIAWDNQGNLYTMEHTVDRIIHTIDVYRIKDTIDTIKVKVRNK